VVQEELALHDEEREVMQRPAHNEETNEVVILHHCSWRTHKHGPVVCERQRILTVMEVLIATLSTEDEETTDDEVRNNRRNARPPNEGITDEVYLTMILDPEVLASPLLIST
jgi:hypothetical protein